MAKLARQPWLLGIVSAALLLLPFSIIGPVPYRRTFFAWIAFVPLLFGLLRDENLRHPKALLRGTFAAYVMGVLWFAGNCYWIYQTMLYYGGLPPFISAGILIAYSLILGLYFAAFGLAVTVTARAFRSSHALLAAPFFWVALEVLSARLTKVPWDSLGYSQIDNFVLTRLAPFTGVYGLSFVLVAGNALIAWGLFAPKRRLLIFISGLLLALVLQNGDHFAPRPAPVQATAVLLQQNLNVNQDNSWPGAEYDEHVSQFIKLSTRTCGPYLAGMPELDAYPVTPDCPATPVTPGHPGMAGIARAFFELRSAPPGRSADAGALHARAGDCRHQLLRCAWPPVRFVQLRALRRSRWRSRGPLRQDPPGPMGRVHTV